VSRQRAWGVPITVFFCNHCGELMISREIIDHVAGLVEAGGADVWFSEPVEHLLPEGTTCRACGSKQFRKETDILDVWFDSGVSYAAVMEKRDYLDSPADMYLEGSDQHRGWFHSSLLCSVGTRGDAPYRSVLTHGFVVDGAGKAMHKSAGNVIAPEELIGKYGAEILRLWVAGEDYRDNIRLSQEILQRLTEAYRRIRNTCRFLLGNLSDFDPPRHAVPYGKMELLDRWALNRLQELSERVLKAYDAFEFHLVYHNLHNFCSLDLSSLYLDVVKDRLYTSPKNSRKRRSAQTAMQEILEVLVRLMAPILSFTADEIWQYMGGEGRGPSVHADVFIPVRKEFRDPDLAARWETILAVRKEITKALEMARRDKRIGHPLDAAVTLGLSPERLKALGDQTELLRTLAIVSSLEIVGADSVSDGISSETLDGVRIKVDPSTSPKCERCWVRDRTVGQDQDRPTLCTRCLAALTEMEAEKP
jgi:isoleucyl-tRNA synthetase